MAARERGELQKPLAMATTSSRLPSPLPSSLHPAFSSACSSSSCLAAISVPSSPPSPPPPPNPWNRNLAEGHPVPVFGEPSSWPPLPSSSYSSIVAAAAATAAASSSSSQIHEPGSAANSTAEPSRSDPSAASSSASSASPSPPEEVGPPPILGLPGPSTGPAPGNAGAPRPAAPLNSGNQGHRRWRNHQGNHKSHNYRGSRGSFRHNGYNGNGGYLIRGPVPNWNPGFGFDLNWPYPSFWGVSPATGAVPPQIGPLANYYNASVPSPYLPPYQFEGPFHPDLNGPYYHGPPPPPETLPLGLGPVPAGVPLQPGTLNYSQNAAVQHQDILNKLRNQIEYYFSDENLVTDDYLKRQMDCEGWVHIHTIAKFKRVVALTKDLDVIWEALLSSSTVELQGDKMRKKFGWATYCRDS